MAYRNPHVKLASYIRSGYACLPVGGGELCIAHSLPETPDSISLTPIAQPNSCVAGIFIRSWDSSFIQITNSHAAAAHVYLVAQVVHTIVK